MKRSALFIGLVALLGMAANAAAQQSLGRLFFTPEQRAALDARRKARIPDKPAAAVTAESPTTRVDGQVVFVDRGLPGDRIRARVTKANRRFAEARFVDVETPGPARVAARCKHVAVCGGCRFQELPYPDQAALKMRQVREALQHLGRG